MEQMEKALRWLTTSKRFQIVIAVVLTIALMISIPAYAWFTSQ